MNVLRAKLALAKIALHPVVGISLGRLFSDHLPVGGAVINVQSSSVKPEYKAAIFWRRYEHTELRFIRWYLRRDLDIVELGSSIGVVSAHLATLRANDRKMVTVEANSSLIDSVVANTSANGGVRISRCATSLSPIGRHAFSSRATIRSGAMWL